MVERKRIVGDETTVEEKKYYISSMETTAKAYCRIIRDHWSIENRLHWVLDATFREDQVPIAKDHSPKNLSIIRKMGMALLKKDTSRKASLRRKQNISGWDNDFLKSLFVESL